MTQHFVTFLSPGTFFHEETTLPIDSWNVDKACKMAHTIYERHDARPFGFHFTTRARKEDDLDSKVVKTSGRYFLGGKILRIRDVEAMNETEPGKYDILLNNMKYNNWPKIVMNDNSGRIRIFQPLEKGDVFLNFKIQTT